MEVDKVLQEYFSTRIHCYLQYSTFANSEICITLILAELNGLTLGCGTLKTVSTCKTTSKYNTSIGTK